MLKMLVPEYQYYLVGSGRRSDASVDDLFKAVTYTGGSAKAVDISCAIAAHDARRD